MLILARKAGQSIIISDSIEISIVEIRGEQVRLGITAPSSISIYRRELLDQITAENLIAADTIDISTKRLKDMLTDGSAQK